LLYARRIHRYPGAQVPPPGQESQYRIPPDKKIKIKIKIIKKEKENQQREASARYAIAQTYRTKPTNKKKKTNVIQTAVIYAVAVTHRRHSASPSTTTPSPTHSTSACDEYERRGSTDLDRQTASTLDDDGIAAAFGSCSSAGERERGRARFEERKCIVGWE
jgi:hypothetical protein